MIAETYAYKLLKNDKTLNELFDSYRGRVFGGGFAQGMFTYDIPETPTNFKKAEFAPMLRINPIYDNVSDYADDEELVAEQRIVINFWCKTASQSDEISKRIDKVLKDGGFERYTANEKPRYKDPDIDLLMNVRKYRIFNWKNKEE